MHLGRLCPLILFVGFQLNPDLSGTLISAWAPFHAFYNSNKATLRGWHSIDICVDIHKHKHLFESQWCVLACNQARLVPWQYEICKWVGNIIEQITGMRTVGSLLAYWHALCIMQQCILVLLPQHNLIAGGTYAFFVCLGSQNSAKIRDKRQQWTNKKWIPFTFQWNSDQGHSNVAAFQCLIKTCKTNT